VKEKKSSEEEPAKGKKKEPTPVAKKTRASVKRAQETPAKPAKKSKK
jgi:hypothetical protein